MVAKINSGSSLYSTLAYNQNKLEKGVAAVLMVNRMIEPRDANYTISLCLRSFEPYLSANRRTENPIIHISLNPAPKDKLDDELFSELAQEYMQKLGYGDQPYIVYKHQDIARHHLHVVSVKVDETGKKIRDNFQKRLSMRICREIETKFGLVPAYEKLKQGCNSLTPVDYKDGNLKQQIANVIRPISEDWFFLSFREYKALLSAYNVHVEEVKGIRNELPYFGLVYAALDENGEVCGSPIKSSKFGKARGIEALKSRIENSNEQVSKRSLKDRPKRIISKVFQDCNSLEKFEKELLKQGIKVLFRRNESGRIYGITFIDNKQKFVFKGSRLGHDFSTNSFNEKFDASDGKSETKLPSKEPTSYIPNNNTTLENLSGLLGIEAQGVNYEEEAFIRRVKRKNKRKQKL